MIVVLILSFIIVIAFVSPAILLAFVVHYLLGWPVLNVFVVTILIFLGLCVFKSIP